MTAVDIVAIGDGALNKRSKAGRPPRDPAEWKAAFLAHYRAKGNIHTAAQVAGVSVNTVAKHRRASPAFHAEVRLAYQEYGAMLREKLADLGIDKGNVIALLASLKAHSKAMAARYSEKAVDARVMNLTLNVNTGVVAAEADTLVARMLARQSPLELKALAGEIVDVSADPPAPLAYSSPPEEEA